MAYPPRMYIPTLTCHTHIQTHKHTHKHIHTNKYTYTQVSINEYGLPTLVPQDACRGSETLSATLHIRRQQIQLTGTPPAAAAVAGHMNGVGMSPTQGGGGGGGVFGGRGGAGGGAGGMHGQWWVGQGGGQVGGVQGGKGGKKMRGMMALVADGQGKVCVGVGVGVGVGVCVCVMSA